MLRLRKSIWALIFGGGFALFSAVISGTPMLWNWQEGWDLYALFRLRDARPAPADVVLVPIDERARNRLFLPEHPDDFERCRDVRLDKPTPGYRNPDPASVLARWPRCLHARALDSLARGQPAAIVMDISFRPRSDPSGAFSEQDRALGSSIRKAGSVLLALHINTSHDMEDQAQPIAREIESAALALAPFLVLGDQLDRADKFCTFKEEDHGWSGPCLPTVAHQLTSVRVYEQFRALLERSEFKHLDLVRDRGHELLADGALQAPVRLIRHLATSDQSTAQKMRAVLAATESPASADERRLHNLADIYLGPAIRYFNFYGPPGSFQMLRYEDLVAGDEKARPSEGSLRGKIVFIGFAEHRKAETSEHFSTPFNEREKGIKLSGVELAATAYANLHDGSSVVPLSFEWRAPLVLALGVLFTALGVVLISKYFWFGWTAIAAVAAIYGGTAYLVFERLALWLPLSPVGLALIGGVGAGFIELKRTGTEAERQRAEAERRNQQLDEALSALLPPEAVDWIVNRNRKLAELRESVLGTCVMTDLKGFTALFKTRTSKEVARILDGYFQMLFPEVKRHGGNPIDVIGDAMLAVWHGATPDPAVRRRACMAALQLAEAAERFREPGSSNAFRTRIGVEYGELTIGMVGALSHLEYRPVGMPVNTASRLQELCEALGARILVTGSVIAGLDDFLVRDLGHFELRDIPDAVHMYELIAERRSATPEQLALCEKFGLALGSYRDGRLAQAGALFEELAERDPASQFYLERCGSEQTSGHGIIVQERITKRR